MGKRDALIARYAEDLRSKCGMEPDMELLRKVTVACGPLIYDDDAAVISGRDSAEREVVKRNFLTRRLGLHDDPELDAALDFALETYGAAEPRKYRAVVYYMLTKHFGREHVFR